MKKIIISLLFAITLLSVLALIFFLPKSLNSRLDDLEEIIISYESKFEDIQRGSSEYSDMIQNYNDEIYRWAEVFEFERYKRDSDGKIVYDDFNKPIYSSGFNKEVEKRFYELNNRMTRMVLGRNPRKDVHEQVAGEKE